MDEITISILNSNSMMFYNKLMSVKIQFNVFMVLLVINSITWLISIVNFAVNFSCYLEFNN
jgi:hypothetical protein